MSTLTVDCSDESFERLRCTCGEWSRLSLDEAEVAVGEIRISGSEWAICDLAAEARRRSTRAVQVDIANAPGARQRFGYCEGVGLKYSALDTKYIPGLA